MNLPAPLFPHQTVGLVSARVHAPAVGVSYKGVHIVEARHGLLGFPVGDPLV